MKHLLPGLKLFVLMSLFTGLLYPALITIVAQIFFKEKADGQMTLIAQKFENEKYFWGRPSSVAYNPLPSGGSNLGPTSAELKKQFEDRKTKLRKSHPEKTYDCPQDLLFASGSGLDPDISPASAMYQIERVSRARTGISVDQLSELIQQQTQNRQWGVFGEPRVNVLQLNLALDSIEVQK